MNPKALNQARERLEKAEFADHALQSAVSLKETKAAWSDFLLAANVIFSKLQQGSKGHPKSIYWFGTVVNKRKNDSLLRYLHHARNADEHGLEEVITAMKSELHLMPDGTYSGYYAPEGMEISSVEIFADGLPVPLNNPVKSKSVVLVSVKDRNGNIFNVPSFQLEPKIASSQAIVLLRNVMSESLTHNYPA